MMTRKKSSRWAAIGFIIVFISACLAQTFFFSQAINLDERFCAVHQRSTQFGVCKIYYGEETFDKRKNLSKKESFPLSNSSLNGGCMVGQTGYWKFTMYCPDCRRAETAWLGRE